MEDSWTAQALRQAGETLFGPLAFLIFSLVKTLLAYTDLDYRLKNSSVVLDGQSGCGVSDQAFAFQTCSKTRSSLDC